jgi:ubiquinone/menaquinone biosynthesis C-methylase UbiE
MKTQLKKNVHVILGEYERRDMSTYRILEVGCGNGNVLMDWHQHGAQEEQLFGADLLPDRLQQAHASYPLFPLVCSDGQHLPFYPQSFDLAMQFTAFSSILDNQIRKNVAAEMRRVVKLGGLVIWYDFWLNPTNPQTRGIRPAEIKGLFPGCRYEFHRITLAPPITRRLATFSWGLCLFLESLKIFNTHYLVAIQPD